MKVMFDANILLDVFQDRKPWYEASAACVDHVLRGTVEGHIPAHVLTTFYYVLKKYGSPQSAQEAVLWLLEHFTVTPCDHDVLDVAIQGEIRDFEDAVVAVSAECAGCVYILTRNPDDFTKTPLQIVSPVELLQVLQ